MLHWEVGWTAMRTAGISYHYILYHQNYDRILLMRYQGQYEPSICLGGWYCPLSSKLQLPCPEDFFCPTGSTYPQPCIGMSNCPIGSTREQYYGGIVIAAIIDVTLIILYFMFKGNTSVMKRPKLWYEKLVTKKNNLAIAMAARGRSMPKKITLKSTDALNGTTDAPVVASVQTAARTPSPRRIAELQAEPSVTAPLQNSGDSTASPLSRSPSTSEHRLVVSNSIYSLKGDLESEVEDSEDVQNVLAGLKRGRMGRDLRLDFKFHDLSIVLPNGRCILADATGRARAVSHPISLRHCTQHHL